MKVWLTYGFLSVLAAVSVGCADSSNGEFDGNNVVPTPDPILDTGNGDPSSCVSTYAKSAPNLSITQAGSAIKISMGSDYSAGCLKIQKADALSGVSPTIWSASGIAPKTSDAETAAIIPMPSASPGPTSAPVSQVYYRVIGADHSVDFKSSNIVGSIQIALKANVLKFLSNPVSDKLISDLIRGVAGKGQFHKLINKQFSVVNINNGQLVNSAMDAIVKTGEGFFIRVDEDTQISFLGSVLSKADTTIAAPNVGTTDYGLGSAIPLKGHINTFGYVPRFGDTLFRLNNRGSFDSYSFDDLVNDWVGPVGMTPVLEVGEGFYLRTLNRGVRLSQMVK